MAKKGFEDLNNVERNLMINGLKTHIIMKKCVRISEKNAINILQSKTRKAEKEKINKIPNKCSTR
jgi:hypothetical protein